MACVYILFSKQLHKHYIGSCKDFDSRMQEHINKVFEDSFTRKADDWQEVFCLYDLEYEQARKIEGHIKRMKSSKYIQSLIKYSEIGEKLKKLYDK